MWKTIQIKTLYKYIFLILVLLVLVFSYQLFDINQIHNLVADKEGNAGYSNLTILVFFLRFISIVIPVLPGTYCSVIAGYLFGIKNGLLIIFMADLLSCSLAFMISRKLGREFVQTLLGKRQMQRIERLSKNHIEKNFFLMTALLHSVLVLERRIGLYSWVIILSILGNGGPMGQG